MRVDDPVTPIRSKVNVKLLVSDFKNQKLVVLLISLAPLLEVTKLGTVNAS